MRGEPLFDRRALLASGAVAAAGLTISPRLFAERTPARASLATLSPGDEKEDNPATIAARKGLCFGTCISVRPLEMDPAYAQLSARYSNTLVHASSFMWKTLQPRPDAPYDFRGADRLIDWAGQRGKAVRGHMLLDWAELPPWLEPHVASLSPSAAEAMLRAHVRRLVRRYRGRMIQWNVANEPMNGGTVRPYCWQTKLGEAYLDIAFDEAANADPGTPLAINQNLIEMTDPFNRRTRDGLLALVQRLLDRKVPLASVGIEGHLRPTYPVDQNGLDGFCRELASLDLGFMITEFDIDDRAFPMDIAQRDAECAALTRDFLDVTLAQPRCEGLIFWGFIDRYNWILREAKRARPDGAPQRPTAFDAHYRPKPMWDVVVEAVRRAPGPGRRSILKG